MTTIDLPGRLASLGDALDLADGDLAPAVLRRLDEPVRTGPRRLVLAAAVVAATITGAVVHPASRGAIARRLGLDGVDIEYRPDLSVPATPPSIVGLPGPGESRIVTVDGLDVLVSTIDATITPRLIEKSFGPGTSLQEVDVDGGPGVWIVGAPHTILFETPDGSIVSERVAGNTLLWQDGELLRRVEGFADLEAALRFARSGT